MASENKRGRGNVVGSGLPQGVYTMAKAAALMGVHRDTLKRWVEQGFINPAAKRVMGKLAIALFTDEEIEQGKALKTGQGNLVKRAGLVK